MRWVTALLVWLLAQPALAHELRPAYLELREDAPGEYQVRWKTPRRGEARLALEPELSGTQPLAPVVTRPLPGAALQTWRLRAPALRGQRLYLRGLDSTLTDALVRIEFADGTTWTQRLTGRAPGAVIPVRESPWAVAGVYLRLGVEHLLTGLDHLLFLLGLLLLTRGPRTVVKTVTAFTLAHSLTLAAATLGLVRVPPQPVEVVIALSIAFVAAEAARGGQGALGRAPWRGAFLFGLLHGLGFAGALGESGLPEGHIPLALLFFNLGVEAGQLLFAGLVLGLAGASRRTSLALPSWSPRVPPYALGAVAMFWVLQRVAAF